MLRRFENGPYYVWLDSDTNDRWEPHFSIVPTEAPPHSGDKTCHVAFAIWLGLDAARKLRDSLSEAIFAAEEELATRTGAPKAPCQMQSGLDEARAEADLLSTTQSMIAGALAKPSPP